MYIYQDKLYKYMEKFEVTITIEAESQETAEMIAKEVLNVNGVYAIDSVLKI